MTFWHWAGRAVCLAITFGLAHLRREYLPPENNLPSVALTQALSAMCNACAIVAAYLFVRGRASFDLQRLAYCAIVVNFLGVFAYAAKSSPLVFTANMALTVISYAQLIRILWPSNGDIFDPRWRRAFLRVAYSSRQSLHLEKKK